MLNWEEEWNISFAGCGFSSIYYLGALSCIAERVPRLVQGASKICGASSGCLVAAGLTVGIPIETCCADVMSTAKEARKSKLGVFQPTFNLLQMVRGSLLDNLPEDAHVRASGKLCVSLTRVSDGQNVLVSEFGSREELIQVLTCSCFFPLFCGLIPPSYRGVRYVDGALSNNMPLIDQRNTITVSPFSGEGDICPREGTFNLLEVHYGNVSIQANTGNVHRIYMSFCPPKLEVLAEICHNGYMDALHFLKKNEYLPPSLVAEVDAPKPACCEPVNSSSTEAGESKQPNGPNAPQEEHRWLDQQLIQNLPVSIKRVLCEACRDRHAAGGLLTQVTEFLPVKVASYLLIPFTLPVELTFVVGRSMMLSGCAVICRLLTSAMETWRGGTEDTDSVSPERGWSSRSSGLEHRNQRKTGENIQPFTSTITPTSHRNLCWDAKPQALLSDLAHYSSPQPPHLQ